MDSPEQSPFQDPVPLPINGELDLHGFKPREIKDLIPEYLTACKEKNIFQIRIVHGKGIGNLRRTVHSLLTANPDVESFALAGEQMGSWGATLVTLHRNR